MNISSAVFPGLTKISCQVPHECSLTCYLFEMADYLDFAYCHIFAKDPAVA